MIADRIIEGQNLLKHLRLQEKRAKLKLDIATEDIGAIRHLLQSNCIDEQSDNNNNNGFFTGSDGTDLMDSDGEEPLSSPTVPSEEPNAINGHDFDNVMESNGK